MNDSAGWASPGSTPADSSDPTTTPAGTPPAADQPNQPGLPDQPGVPDQPGAPDRSDKGGQGDQADAPPAPPTPPTAPVPNVPPVPPNWSPNQPPPGRWNGPGTPSGTSSGPVPPPPPPPAPGYTQPPSGYGNGGWGAPPPQGWGWSGVSGQGPGPVPPWRQAPYAPKPGVIPLRPLGVGEIFDGAIATMRIHWRTVFGISLVVALLTVTASTLVNGFFFDHGEGVDALRSTPDPTLHDMVHAVGDTLAGGLLASVISVLGQIVATAMLTMIVSRAVLGRATDANEAWRDARPQVPRLLGLTLLLPLIAGAVLAVSVAPGTAVALLGNGDAGAGFIALGVLVGTVVAVWLLVSLCLASPALMLERQGVLTSIARSFRLVRGTWWRVFGVQLLSVLLTLVVTSIIGIPFSMVASVTSGGGTTGWPYLIITGLGTVVGATLTFPFSAGVSVLLYLDQRIRKESLDVELIRAAAPTRPTG
ncbi:hypothetical protein K7472_24795 [Streptomyces sp. PTM05]|uniref:DUF7847 domain-containing protein n=1 Tax=Streptantibioticus parmotrematis TaxID=2873249 RepID=A0ABS7QYM6_9ACTN|nr:hypothetical protein [Streptantibioticus parmotrematis]MBY8888033.1 hypothetical protein [Streptantibioticus parmotrematis]